MTWPVRTVGVATLVMFVTLTVGHATPTLKKADLIVKQ